MMKKRIRRNLIVCLLMILSMCLYGKAFADEGWEKHTITVEGGYATDENGKRNSDGTAEGEIPADKDDETSTDNG